VPLADITPQPPPFPNGDNQLTRQRPPASWGGEEGNESATESVRMRKAPSALSSWVASVGWRESASALITCAHANCQLRLQILLLHLQPRDRIVMPTPETARPIIRATTAIESKQRRAGV